jgi:hypothetical protein
VHVHVCFFRLEFVEIFFCGGGGGAAGFSGTEILSEFLCCRFVEDEDWRHTQ